MRKMTFLLSLFVLLNSPDCDSQKHGERITALEADVKQLKAEIIEIETKPKVEHHYELRNEGLRTWRFDSATGETCIQLTSEADWKHKETKGQSCTCSDNSDHWGAMPTDSDAQQRIADSYYNRFVKTACGD